MRVLPRVVAALVAIVAYLVLWQVLTIALLVVSAMVGFDIPGYHEPPQPLWWGVLWGLVWIVGLIVVVWWVVFRLPRSRWWRGRGVADARPQGQDAT